VSASRIRTQAVASPDSKTLAFEVASVKPNRARDGERDANLVGGRLTMTYVTLHDLVQFAYPRPDGNLRQEVDISGGPGWFNSDRFDVAAKIEGVRAGLDAANTAAGAATADEMRAIDRARSMMQTLLADRFNLAVHRELRPLPAFRMSLARADGTLGPQLRKVDIDCAALRAAGRQASPGAKGVPCGGFGTLAPGHSAGHAIPVSMLAIFLERLVGRTVLDQSGLAGTFDVDLTWTPDRLANPDDLDSAVAGGLDTSSVFTSIREQLGLRLESTRVPIDVLVVDRAEPPASN
jgi:uncharacterized protein (TIGR03435 family)